MPGRLLGFGRPRLQSTPPGDHSPFSNAESAHLKAEDRRDSLPRLGMDHLKRASLSALHHHHPSDERRKSIARDGQSKSPAPKSANRIEVAVESPPNMFYGTSSSSSGALFSGQLRVHVGEAEVTFTAFHMELLAHIITKKPVAKDCPDCNSKTTELKQWVFLKEPKTLKAGTHNFPFSHLLPGHLPATTKGRLATLDYYLDAKATTSNGETLARREDISLLRAVMPASDKTSIRIFPPTNLTAHVTYNPVIHPIGDTVISMRLMGVTKRVDSYQERWRLRKMNWRIEEKERMVSPACSKHAKKVGGEGKGILHEELRHIGHGDLKEGWKSDFDDGNIEVDFKICATSANRPLCDIQTPVGLEVKHVLVVELVVAEEWVPDKRPRDATPSGIARVLRMQFPLIITERAGMGISWDEEQPPTYEDVPASPPGYPATDFSQIVDYEGPPLGEPPPLEEEMHLGSPAFPAASSSAALHTGRAFTAEDLEVVGPGSDRHGSLGPDMAHTTSNESVEQGELS